MGAFADALVRDIRLQSRLAFDQAQQRAKEKVRDAAPRDTGNLRQGIRQQGSKVLTGNVFSVTIASTATGYKAVDYPAILENAGPRISAKKSKHLHFKIGNRYVKKESIENRHDKWWTLAWGLNEPPTLWDQCLREAFEGQSS